MTFRPGYLFLSALLFLSCSCLSAQSEPWGERYSPIPGGHQGPVNVIIPLEGNLALSAGEDGFLEIWDTLAGEGRERYQVSPYAIKSMVLRPGKDQISLIESDGMGLYRISAWDYREKRRLFTLRFRDPISYINYSAQGNFLIAARSGKTGVVFIDPETGELLQSPAELTGAVSLAATGKSERIMVSYAAAGVLSYWELDTMTEIRHFEVPPGMVSPLLFGGGRFLAGFDREGLLILDAVSGTLILRQGEPRRGTLLQTDPEKSEFACLSETETGEGVLYFFTFTTGGRLNTPGPLSLPPAGAAVSSAAVEAGHVLLGGAAGELHLVPRDGGPPAVMRVLRQERLREIAASPSTLGFLSENGSAGFIPLDYFSLTGGGPIRLEGGGGYSRITAGSPASPRPGGEWEGEGGEREYFILWQAAGGRVSPLVKTFSGPRPLEGDRTEKPLEIAVRGALQSVSILGDRVLLLDTAGTIAVIDLKTGEPVFNFSSVGSLDADFLDEGNLVIGRSAVSGNSPFLMVNIATGETVPLAYPSAIGARVYRSREGVLYGAVIDQRPGGSTTALIRLSTSNPALSLRLVEYQEEDTLFDIAESSGVLASTLGGDQAAIYRADEIIPLERGAALPQRLTDGNSCFIVLDQEGSITWHDPWSGKLLALLRLYEDQWVLESEGRVLRGPLIR